jgi:hypothetical protein
MGFLDELQQPEHPRRRDYQKFTTRYEQGRPDEGYDGKEVASRYRQVATNADQHTYRKAAHAALGRMQPAQRRQFGQMVQQQAQQRGYQANYDGQSSDPGALADLVTQVHQQDPGLLSQLLGAVGGGSSGGKSSGGSLGGVAENLLGGGSGGAAGNVLGDIAGDNPIAKAALAGITSYAAKNLMDQSS